LANADVKFAADRMLGRLVKWLRIIGQDTIYGPHLSGHGLIRTARADDRLILTRDGRLKRKNPPALLFIVGDHYREQLRQVIRACDLKLVEEKLFSRCLKCNSVLQFTPKKMVTDRVPAYVFSSQERFFSCAVCRRIYWPATHHAKMLEEIKNLGSE
jgi:uncharacterized protein with PIN domain